MSPINNTDPESEFVSLITESQGALRLYVASILPGDPAVADITQQVNITIWKKRDDFQLGTNFKAWAFSIARFEVLNYRKRQAKDSIFVFSEELDALFAEEISEQTDVDVLRRTALQDCIAKLKQSEQELIQARYHSAESLSDYAGKINRSVNGLKVSLHRIRDKLHVCIERTLARQGVNP